MKQFSLVNIDSQEFEKKILEIISKNIPKVRKNSRFIELSDGWIKDLNTGLEWGKSSNKSINFNDAKEYCAKEGGRLPDRTELQTIQDLEKHSPCIDASIFRDTKCEYYWTSTKCAWVPNAVWCVSFCNGFVSYSIECGYNYVRPVRSSQ